jgi:dipeptidyl aminopeptidase/acylaminoacyl peptidase
MGLPYQTVRVPTVNGKSMFAWFVPSPKRHGKVSAVALMHGWGGNAEDMLPFASLLYCAGYAVLLLDARNHGRSDADGFSSMPRFAEDLVHGFNWLGRQPNVDSRRLVLLGHSVGAGAALLAASRHCEPAAVVSIAAFGHPAQLMRRLMRAHHVPYRPIGWLVLRYVEHTIQARFDEIAPCHTIARVTCPVLVVHGEEDDRVSPADARRIYANRRDDRTELLMLPETGHESRDAIAQHGAALVAFLDRFVKDPSGPHPSQMQEQGFTSEDQEHAAEGDGDDEGIRACLDQDEGAENHDVQGDGGNQHKGIGPDVLTNSTHDPPMDCNVHDQIEDGPQGSDSA